MLFTYEYKWKLALPEVLTIMLAFIKQMIDSVVHV